MTKGDEYTYMEKRKERLARLKREKAVAEEAARAIVKDEYKDAVELYKPQVVIGIDEVGTGALAGPVVIGACVMAPYDEFDVKDSKAYNPSPKKRLAAHQRVMTEDKVILTLTETIETSELIEKGQAIAMELGYNRLVERVKKALDGQFETIMVAMDGKVPIVTDLPQVALIKGDEYITPISAASVVAKIYRDGLMHAMDHKYPGYKFGLHKGYGTAVHIELLKLNGPCAIHRTYIARIQKALERAEKQNE